MTSSHPELQAKHYYLIGIKGVGMTALAQCLVDRGAQVSGCDVAEDFVTKEMLDNLSISIDTSTDPTLPDTVDCLVFGGAHQGAQHPLVVAAQQRAIPVTTLAKLIGLLSETKQTIAVCGVGGKSTTSAALAWIFEQTNQDPSYAVGVGEIIGLPRTGRWSNQGKHFVVEADEYAENPQAVANGETLIPRFQYLQPTIIICTNLQFDHPDVYQDEQATEAVFLKFFRRLKENGTLIWNGDDPKLGKLIVTLQRERTDIRYLSFGTDETTALEVRDDGYRDEQHQTSLLFHDTTFGQAQPISFTTSLPGTYNLRNEAAAILASLASGISINETLEAIAAFNSTTRRFQRIQTIGQTLFFDDYAHHPSEIAAVLHACRAQFPDRRLLVIFQPHTYSRTQALLPEFAQALAQADVAICLPIFGSAREKVGTVRADDITKAITQLNTACIAKTAASFAEAKQLVEAQLTGASLVLTLGAGDVYELHKLFSTTEEAQR